MSIQNNSDAANVAAVSGFYGPGAWAAWICSLTSTWYTLLLRPKLTGCSDLIVTLLYTNWAAVELLKQVNSENRSETYASLGAAMTITFWGWCHAVLQVSVCILAVPRSSVTRRRALFAISGVIVPTFASMRVVWGTFIADGTLFTRSLPAGLAHDELESWYSESYDLAATVVGLAFHTIILVLVSDMFWIARPGVFATMCTYGFLGIFALAIYSAYRYSPGFVRPCSPQSIGEADQAFAVLCGLAALVYQIGPDIWNETGPSLWHRARDCYAQRQISGARRALYDEQLSSMYMSLYPIRPRLETAFEFPNHD